MIVMCCLIISFHSLKNQKSILAYTKKGYNFTITLDNTVKSIEDVEKNNTNNNAENEESAETSSDLKDESSTCDNLEKTVQVESNVEDEDTEK